MISDFSNCIYEVNLIDCSCSKSNNTASGDYLIYVNIAYKESSDDYRYYYLPFRVNTSPYNGIDIFSGSKNGQPGCIDCLKKMAVFYMVIIYPDAFESVDISSIDV